MRKIWIANAYRAGIYTGENKSLRAMFGPSNWLVRFAAGSDKGCDCRSTPENFAMKKTFRYRWKRFLCWLLLHNWTCCGAEGIQPTEWQRQTIDGFLEYGTEWCKRCGETVEPGPFLQMFAEFLFDRRKPNEENGRTNRYEQLH